MSSEIKHILSINYKETVLRMRTNIHSTYAEVIGQLSGVCARLPCACLGLNLNLQTWQQGLFLPVLSLVDI